RRISRRAHFSLISFNRFGHEARGNGTDKSIKERHACSLHCLFKQEIIIRREDFYWPFPACVERPKPLRQNQMGLQFLRSAVCYGLADSSTDRRIQELGGCRSPDTDKLLRF